ncbi:hypothetical protein HGRIS_003139 [Hohenbuehelia grisea]|uniref:Uncharacterized protein n=1 Tax=Hohenbuehelia grisea TaxID=104357 RepID=A0ABR3JN44_9AGAR
MFSRCSILLLLCFFIYTAAALNVLAVNAKAKSLDKGSSVKPRVFGRNGTTDARPRDEGSVWCLAHCADDVIKETACGSIRRRVARKGCFCSRETQRFPQITACMRRKCSKDIDFLRKYKRDTCKPGSPPDAGQACICGLDLGK